MKWYILILAGLLSLTCVSAETSMHFLTKGYADTLYCSIATGCSSGSGGYVGYAPYLYNDTTYMYFNESKLNATIDIRAGSGGSNTTQEMINAVNGTALNGENFTNLPATSGGNTTQEIIDAANTTTFLKDWSYLSNTSVEMITAVNYSGLLIDWNGSGFIKDWSYIDTNESVRVGILEGNMITINTSFTANDTMIWQSLLSNVTKLDGLYFGNTTEQILNAVNGTGLNGTKFKDVNAKKIAGTEVTNFPTVGGLMLYSDGIGTASWGLQPTFRWSDVLQNGASSGANSPLIELGQVIKLGTTISKYNISLSVNTPYNNLNISATNSTILTGDMRIQGDYLVKPGTSAFCADGFPLACMDFIGGASARYTLNDFSDGGEAHLFRATGRAWHESSVNATAHYGQVMTVFGLARDGDDLCSDHDGNPTSEHIWTCDSCKLATTGANKLCSDTTNYRNCICISQN